VISTEISIDEVFNTDQPNSNLYFAFESIFEPYKKYAYDDIKGIDLVVKHENHWLRPLEIKLTVIPDETTHKLGECEWGSEIVVRPPTTYYCALGIADSCSQEFDKVRRIIEPLCSNIQYWDSQHEILAKRDELLEILDQFQQEFVDYQKPFLMQPIWKTQGKMPILCENAFDIFIWSDFALCRTFLDRSKEGNEISRHMRSAARLARILYELSTRGKANINTIYTTMAFGHQTDKEFSLSGRITRNYMQHPRLIKPILKRNVVKEIILGGGEKKLSPERRFDQTIYWTAAMLFDEKIK
jgi:hypothetical protein